MTRRHAPRRRAAGGAAVAGLAACAAIALSGAATARASLPAPVPIQTLSTATWQGMEILAQASTPLPFIVFDGTHGRTIEPTKRDSMHLMVMLSDQRTGTPIPYASVWATITTAGGRVIYDERQWPMISRFMGPHYGNDVALPGAGTYHLTLLISPPVAARSIALAHVWTSPHRVRMTFTWKPPKGS